MQPTPTEKSAPLAAAGAILALLALATLARAGATRAPPPTGAPTARAASAPDAGPSPEQIRRLLEDRPLDVNLARAADLELLPRIGPTLARRIVEERARGGPFERVDDLGRVRGIGPATLARLRPLVTTGPAAGDAGP